jgi:hypothetical protein
MDTVETRILREEWDLEPRLRELGLDRNKLLLCRDAANAAAADSSPLFPANAPGTFSYHFGTRELRAQFVGTEWELDREDGIESIKNSRLKIKVVFQNVDVACSDDVLPKPRSPKGSGAERACSGNLFGHLPTHAPRPKKGWSTYYLMVADDGAAELSLVVVKRRTFTSFVERIFLAEGGEGGGLDSLDTPGDDYADAFDVKVARK